VVVFPELSLTGHELDAAAVDPADDRFAPVIDACAATGSIALVGRRPQAFMESWLEPRPRHLQRHRDPRARGGHRSIGHGRLRRGVLDSADSSVQEQRARRIASRHRVWVAIASFAGSTGGAYETAAAQSRSWSPEGVVVASAGRRVSRIARATLTKKTATSP
jgi:predicted amidohydrolase